MIPDMRSSEVQGLSKERARQRDAYSVQSLLAWSGLALVNGQKVEDMQFEALCVIRYCAKC